MYTGSAASFFFFGRQLSASTATITPNINFFHMHRNDTRKIARTQKQLALILAVRHGFCYNKSA